MVETSFNLFDLIVLAVVGLSALLSFFRGFIREILSLGAWIGAAIITLYAFPHAAEYVQPQVNSPVIASGLAAMGTFLCALIVISIINRVLLKYVKTGSDVGLFDNILGLAFGVARGVLLLSIAYFMMGLVLREDDYPEWVQTAKSRPYVEKSAKWLAQVAPNYLNDLTPLKDKDSEDAPADEEKPNIIKAMEQEKESGDTAPAVEWESLDELKKRMEVE
jgi:membrane protein required for colicin V production